MISVCMATFNGEKVIERQLKSILEQLGEADELIIVDDVSTDQTVTICQKLFKTAHCKTYIIKNSHNLGPIFSFEKALKKASGDYLYLSDQDDEWFFNKIDTCQKVFLQDKVDLIIHDAIVVDGKNQQLDASWNHFRKNPEIPSLLKSFYRNNMTGAMMAFTKKVKSAILPFPKDIQMHDQWIYFVTAKNDWQVKNIPQPLMYYVRHGKNVTGMTKRSKKEMLKGRLIMLKCYLAIKKEKDV